MLRGATKEILNMVKRAEQKKSALEQRLKNYEGKKDNDKQKMRGKALLATQSNNGMNVYGGSNLKDIYDDKKTLMDNDHEISEIKREIAGIDKKIGEIKHWTGQFEYEDDDKRREAVSNARDVLRSI